MLAVRLKNASTYFVEIVIAIVTVLIFFLIFLGILNSVFPYSSGLFSLTGNKGPISSGRLTERMSSDFIVSSRGGDRALGSGGGEVFAKITQLNNSVKSKLANSVAWNNAKMGMDLFSNDAVQTFDRSDAIITFDDENFLELGENTLVMIRRIEEDPFLQERRSLMLIVDGELSGKIAATGDKAINMEIATPAGIAKIQSDEGSNEEVEFNVRVNPDKSATIAVFKGIAEMVAGGKVLKISENQAITVVAGLIPEKVNPLPPPPAQISPWHNKTFYYSDLPPQVKLNWKLVEKLNKYHFLLASDPEFKNVLVDEQVSGRSFKHGNLKAGSYYWKVSAMRGWEEGLFSSTKKLSVISDESPPELKVDFPPKVVKSEKYKLTGQTEPGSKVFVGRDEVYVDMKGYFKYDLALQKGVNVIVVEVIDKGGNVTFTSQLVNRKE